MHTDEIKGPAWQSSVFRTHCFCFSPVVIPLEALSDSRCSHWQALFYEWDFASLVAKYSLNEPLYTCRAIPSILSPNICGSRLSTLVSMFLVNRMTINI